MVPLTLHNAPVTASEGAVEQKIYEDRGFGDSIDFDKRVADVGTGDSIDFDERVVDRGTSCPSGQFFLDQEYDQLDGYIQQPAPAPAVSP